MVEFHNVNCHKGVVYVLAGGLVCISSLPAGVTLETSWSQRKVPTRSTIRKIAYHSSSQSYIALASMEEEVMTLKNLSTECDDMLNESTGRCRQVI